MRTKLGSEKRAEGRTLTGGASRERTRAHREARGSEAPAKGTAVCGFSASLAYLGTDVRGNCTAQVVSMAEVRGAINQLGIALRAHKTQGVLAGP